MNKRSFVCTFSLVISTFLIGCASNLPPPDAPKYSDAPAAPPGLATVYIFRPYLSDNGSGVWPVTSLNGIKVADVKVGSYTYIYAKPGTYKITSEKSQALTFLDNVPGEFTISESGSYYLAFISGGKSSVVMVGTNAMSVAGPSNDRWVMLPRQEAMRFLPNMRYMSPYAQTLGS